MIVSLKDENGKIYAYYEWQVVNEYGKWDKRGEYVYIEDAWIHPDYRRKDVLFELIPMITNHFFALNCNFVYWDRKGKKSKTYLISDWLKGDKNGEA